MNGWSWIILIITGLASGIISGMGMGGGAILIPALVLAVNPPQHIAQSVNLLFFVPTAVVAMVIHIKNKSIDFKMGVPIIIFGLAGAFAGSWLAARLAAGDLRKLFGWFLLTMSVYEMFRKGKTDGSKTQQGKTQQGKTQQGKTQQGKTQQGKTQQGKTQQGKTQQGKIVDSLGDDPDVSVRRRPS